MFEVQRESRTTENGEPAAHGRVRRPRSRPEVQEAGVSHGTDRRLYRGLKRAIDLVLSLGALTLLAPLLLVIGCLIRLDSPGPAIYRQERAGYNWRRRRQQTFVMCKFRSMIENCDETVHRQLVKDWIRGKKGSSDSHGPTELVKLANDTRITRVGRFLRKTSLDELPQLWNVLKGDMSLVGPRPVPLYEVEEYEPWQRKRLEATPGITGPWQVQGRGLVSVDEMARLDIEYIERQSVWLDLKILLLTIPVVLTGRGAA